MVNQEIKTGILHTTNILCRKVLYLKQESYEILIEMKDKMEQYIELNRGFAKMRIQFDFDPMSGF